MPDPDVEESQVVPAEFEYPLSPSSPLGDDENVTCIPDTQVGAKQSQRAYNDDAGIDSDSLEQGQESYASRVDDTQYASIEPDTQALHDSLGSKVLDTQFENLELDTQALETQPSTNAVFSPETKRILQFEDTARSNPPPILKEAPSLGAATIKKPEMNEVDPNEGFTFGKPAKHVPGKYTYDPKNNVDRTSKPNPPQESVPMHPVSELPVSKPQGQYLTRFT
jgi:hypothetical protein